MLFGALRPAFLEFLRNLTPQILFLTIALVAGSRLDLRHFQLDLQGIRNAAPYVLSVGVFLAAAIANITLFLEKSLMSTAALDVEADRIKQSQTHAFRKLLALVAASWKHNRRAFYQMALAVAFVQAAFIAVAFMAIQGAITTLQAVG